GSSAAAVMIDQKTRATTAAMPMAMPAPPSRRSGRGGRLRSAEGGKGRGRPVTAVGGDGFLVDAEYGVRLRQLRESRRQFIAEVDDRIHPVGGRDDLLRLHRSQIGEEVLRQRLLVGGGEDAGNFDLCHVSFLEAGSAIAVVVLRDRMVGGRGG